MHLNSILFASHSPDFSEFDGIIVVGGDGYLQEAVTALLSRPDADQVRKIPMDLYSGLILSCHRWYHLNKYHLNDASTAFAYKFKPTFTARANTLDSLWKNASDSP